MPTANGSFRCVFLVVVSLLIDSVYCVPMGYKTLSTICASTRHTPLTSFTKTVQRGETRLEPFSDFPKCDGAWLKLLASPMVQNLRDMTLHKPLASTHGMTPIKPSVRAWILTSYWFGHIFLILLWHNVHIPWENMQYWLVIYNL